MELVQIKAISVPRRSTCKENRDLTLGREEEPISGSDGAVARSCYSVIPQSPGFSSFRKKQKAKSKKQKVKAKENQHQTPSIMTYNPKSMFFIA